MRCLIYCIADAIDFIKVQDLVEFQSAQALSKDVLLMNGTFIFNNGTLVFWDADENHAKKFIAALSSALINSFKPGVVDSISYFVKPDETPTIMPSDKINNDVLILNEDSTLLKLSFSYGLSRSIKLKALETRVDKLVDKYAPLANSIYRRGKIDVSRKGVLKIIGELMVAKSEINLVNNFSYLPIFFWQNPLFENQYVLLEKYMDIEIRAEALNSRLNTLNEIFALLNSYLEYKRSHFLEIAITIFVGIEVVFSFLNLPFLHH